MTNNIEEGIRLMPQFAKRGGSLIVAVQETATGRVLMLASVNEEALNKTFENRSCHVLEHIVQPALDKGRNLGRLPENG